MKKALLAAGTLLCAAASLAQEGSEPNYIVSPFHTESRTASASLQTLQTVQAHLPGWQVAADQQSGGARDLYGPALTVPGADLSAKADYLFANALSALGLQAGDWQLTNATTTPRADYRRYAQKVGGREVVFSRLDLRFTTDGRLQRIVMGHFGQPDAALAPVVSSATALTAGTSGLPAGSTIASTTEGSDWVWFPMPSENGYTLRPAWPFKVEGAGADRLPFILTGWVDALDGKLLYRTNEVQTDADIRVKGVVNTQDAITPPTLVSLKRLEVVLGGNTYNTDTGGYANAPGLTLPQTAMVRLRGPWCVVRDVPTSNTIPSFPTPITALGGTYTFPDTTPSSIRHINAYYHTDSVHGFMKRYLPAFTGLDVALQTNVDVAGTCNAFYNGTSINFYAAGGGCISLATARDVVYHEYGHGISGRFYQSQGTTFQNGGMNEGNSDVWGMSITADPVLGKGFSGTTSFIRRYDVAPKVYPQDIVGEVHADGEIIAGAWWDTYLNIGSLDTMTRLFSQTYYDLPNGPNGTEGEVYHEVLIAALLNDDNDANITNGTPHFPAITQAFARHGIYLLSDAQLAHTEVPHPPADSAIPVSATLTLSQPAFFGSLKVFFRARGTTTWNSLVMSNGGSGNVYSATLPGMAANTFLEYYFGVYDLTTPTANAIFPTLLRPTSPTASTSNIVYQAAVGVAPVMSVNFDTPLPAGWRVGNNTGDDATGGIWIKAEPVGSFLNSVSGQIPVQPGTDHTGGGECLVTGNAANTSASINSADVDNGTTTVISPFYSLVGYAHPVLELWRWYSNDRGNNPRKAYWRMQVRSASTSPWSTNVDYTNAPDANWRRRIFSVRQFIPSSDSFQIRFVAQDPTTTPGTVEAAVDDLVMYDDAPTLSVSDATRAQASVFPNPASDALTVVLERGAQGTMTLCNTTGQVVMSQSTTRGQTRYGFDTHSLASGLYLLVIRGEGGLQATHKVSVQR